MKVASSYVVAIDDTNPAALGAIGYELNLTNTEATSIGVVIDMTKIFGTDDTGVRYRDYYVLSEQWSANNNASFQCNNLVDYRPFDFPHILNRTYEIQPGQTIVVDNPGTILGVEGTEGACHVYNSADGIKASRMPVLAGRVELHIDGIQVRSSDSGRMPEAIWVLPR